MKNFQSVVCLAGLVVGAVALSGCASTTSNQKAEEAKSSMVALRNDLISVKRATDATLAALNAVVEEANTDPKKAFKTYTSSLAKLDAAILTLRTRAQEIRTQRDAYLKLWEAELKGVEGAEVRKLAEQRKARLQETFGKLSPLIEQAKADFDPFSADVHDLQKYLNNDLTLGGIDAARELIAKTLKRGRTVQASLEALIAEMNTAAATIIPPKPV
jgi:DNA repair exonuclease SbcCD ATPase subunit